MLRAVCVCVCVGACVFVCAIKTQFSVHVTPDASSTTEYESTVIARTFPTLYLAGFECRLSTRTDSTVTHLTRISH